MLMVTDTKVWTLEEVHSLPDDGNKYELLRGELLVTPPPTDNHETIASRLTRILDPYVARSRLGFVYRPRAVLSRKGSELEPDLMVRQVQEGRKATWDAAPLPILVVEILSPYTRRRDRSIKREFYLEVGVAEYWIVDPDDVSFTVFRPGQGERVVRDTLTWSPAGVEELLTFEVTQVF